MDLAQIIKTDKQKCKNCNQCISACPTKFANSSDGNYVRVNDNLCIGCGACVVACTHNARVNVDDFEEVLHALRKGEKFVVFCDPAVISNFPGEFLNLNGWLKSLGAKIFFDVSFGAELAARSYVQYIREKKPKLLISQSCPVISNYIQVYKSELLPFLAPINSPLIHSMKMVKEFYPHYGDYKFMAISACAARKRELIETGIGDFNVTIESLKKYLTKQGIALSNYPMVNYTNELPERGVGFFKPGGLTKTLEREMPDIANNARCLSGTEIVFPYLDKLFDAFEKKAAPLLVDLLNCKGGCNAGTGTNSKPENIDELENYINQRMQELKKKYQTERNDKISIRMLNKIIRTYWNSKIYERKYKDLSNIQEEEIKIPDDKNLKKIFATMYKFDQKDIQNCACCGYNSCKNMAVAIHNNYNIKENCFFYLKDEVVDLNKNAEKIIKDKEKIIKDKDKEITEYKQEIVTQSQSLLSSIQKMRNILE
ncbi:MAG: hypothetical protein CSA05_00920 [Bacteroidia bacterium]|nr:MAG: hypothetical protein CSA05_00920 [Bacteroidia bacterium]